MTNRLLLVEDEPDQRGLVAGILRGEGHLADEAGSAEEALSFLEMRDYDLVISDWKLPGLDGMSLLQRVRQLAPGTGFVMVTAYGSISQAVEAIRRGADDYLAKPFQKEALLLAIEKAHRSRQLLNENRRLSEELGERDKLVDLIGNSASMRNLFRRLQKVAGTDVTVLLSGESGTGKELTARALHTLSKRAPNPFVAVNCAAIPEGLVEAEFFGAEKGAYTGAGHSRLGKFEAAHTGSLFLDEIGELSPSIQPKLLRVLQEGALTRVGANREIQVDVRIIAATNRDLKAEVEAGRFREDLFYRLHVVPVGLPPLRERRDDIPRLVQFFAERTVKRYGRRFGGFSARALKRLVDYSWPGNVRELENAVERLILLSEDGGINEEDLPGGGVHGNQRGAADAANGFKLPPEGLSWEGLEMGILRQAMEMSGGNRARAARLLDLNYKAFLYRLEKHGLA